MRTDAHFVMFSSGGSGDWTHLSYWPASHECVTVKETRFIESGIAHMEVLDWSNAPVNKDPNQVSEIITISVH